MDDFSDFVLRLTSTNDFAGFVQRALEQHEKLTGLSAPRHRLRDWKSPFERFGDDEFRSRYLFSKDAVLELHKLLGLRTKSNRGCPVHPLHQLLITLRYFASASFQAVAGDLENVSQASVSRCVATISRAVANLRLRYVRLPESHEIPGVKEEFRALAGFPDVTGCVLSRHVHILNPGGELSNMYLNEHGFCSINVQMTCGPKMQFYNIMADSPGGIQASNVLEESDFGALLTSGRYPGIILADSAYPCTDYLFTPLESPTTASEKRYNESHSKTYQVAQDTVGLWKRRFRCLSSRLSTKLHTSIAIVVATAVLHNFALEKKEPLPELNESTDRTVLPEQQTPPKSYSVEVAGRTEFIAQNF
ncbi:putative nuclease HARBI1 [Ornithodoros turicata]|uniref:putative nuclease HARBI1 n=1 Tax=Ornithodoros turicata TaxID=34597 RepID=UPI00313A3ECA